MTMAPFSNSLLAAARSTTLGSFDGTNGESPNGIIMDGSGNFYGTTEGGGADNDGTVFELASNSGTIVHLGVVQWH